jgi:hypothetical protein
VMHLLEHQSDMVCTAGSGDTRRGSHIEVTCTLAQLHDKDG